MIRFTTLILSLALAASALAAGGGTCPSDTINPVSDVNWNNAFPIIVGGVTTGQGKYPQPSLMHEPAVCICPNRDPYHKIGIGLTYWSPAFLAEVQNKAGCFPSLAGAKMDIPPVAGVAATNSQGLSDQEAGSPRQMQVHWMKYPLFAMMEIFNNLACENTSGSFALAGFTEAMPFWHDALWADIMNPEVFLYANPVAQLACIPDAVASTVHLPIDFLSWCVGSQGSLYPITGAAPNDAKQSPAAGNLLILAKYMQQLSRSFGLQMTIGPEATCHAAYWPNLLRSQYRLDVVKPVHTKVPIRFGKSDSLWVSTPPLNPATRYDNTFLIWQGQQCCAF